MSNLDLKAIGFRLKKTRKALGLLQCEFAEKVNISVTTLSDMETGKSRPGFDFLFHAAKVFDVNLYYILFEEGEMFRNDKNQPFSEDSIFDKDDEDLQEFLWYFTNSKYVRFNVLGLFRKFFNQEEESIRQDIEKGTNKNNLIKNGKNIA